MRAPFFMLPVSRPISGGSGRARKFLVKLQHAAAGAAFAIRDELLQPVQIGGKEAVEIFRGRFDALEGEKLAHQRDVGPPGEFEPFGAVGTPNSVAKARAKALMPAPPV
jgi:hypothetical protein